MIIDDFAFLYTQDRITIGDFVHIGIHATITGGGVVEIGDFACIASAGVTILGGTDDFLGGSMVGPSIPYPYRQPIRSFVHIGKYAVIGSGAIVFPGVTIGEGAAIGAGAVVRHDCKPWMVYVGIPAYPLKERPRDLILYLAEQFQSVVYDSDGRYIPKER